MDPAVIYDPAREVAVMIDIDEMRALGPAYVGPNAEAELNAFLARLTPTIITEMSSYGLAAASKEFWGVEFAALYAPSAIDPSSVEPVDAANHELAALAVHEASVNAGEPPEPGPADTDMAADESSPDPMTDATLPGAGIGPASLSNGASSEQVCFACGGGGDVPGAGPGERAVCNLCHGSGRLMVQASA